MTPPQSRFSCLPPYLCYILAGYRALSTLYPPLSSRPRPCSRYRFLLLVAQAPGLAAGAGSYLPSATPCLQNDATCGVTVHDLLCFDHDVVDSRALFFSLFSFPSSPRLSTFPLPFPSLSIFPSPVAPSRLSGLVLLSLQRACPRTVPCERNCWLPRSATLCLYR